MIRPNETGTVPTKAPSRVWLCCPNCFRKLPVPNRTGIEGVCQKCGSSLKVVLTEASELKGGVRIGLRLV